MGSSKILYFCDHFYPKNTGYSNAFQNFLKSINVNNKLTIDVITPTDLGASNEVSLGANININRIKKLTNLRYLSHFANSYKYARIINNRMKKNKYDLIFIETFDDPLMLTFLSRSYIDKVAVRIHSTSDTEYTVFSKHPVYVLKKFLMKNFVAKKIINIISTNQYHIDFYKKYYLKDNPLSISKKRFFVLPNTVFVNEKNHKVNEKIKIVTLGRLERLGYLQKGFADLLDSLIFLNSRVDLNQKVELLIVGKGSYKNKVLKRIEANNLDFIEVQEYVPHDEMEKILYQSDVVVLPSTFEGMSMFALEGLATSNLLILTNTGGLVDLIKDNGFLVEPKNIEELSDAIYKTICLSKEEIQNKKAVSRELFLERFSPKSINNKFKVLLDIISTK